MRIMSGAMPSFSLIGFGEAGQALAQGLGAEGVRTIAAWDILFPQAERGAPLRAAAQRLGVRLATDCADAVRGADIVVSAVTASSNLDAARAAAPALAPQQHYLDINSVSPRRKREAAAIVAGRACFADVAVMAPVHPLLHKTPLLVAGASAEALAKLLERCAMRPQTVGGDVGSASAIKMVRSVMIKGMEALTQECFLAALAAGVEDRIVASLTQTFPTLDWAALVDYNMERMASHGIRRAAEMREVCATLEELGIEPALTRGTVLRQQRTGEAKLKDVFSGKVPQARHAILGKLLERAQGHLA
jgi:3-hydroxyisobutyrate dehydrogenase-like beta-hydroxyacid dehydrogenase